MIVPGALAVLTPVVVGFLRSGTEPLGGLLAGVTVTGVYDGALHGQRRRRLGQRQEVHRERRLKMTDGERAPTPTRPPSSATPSATPSRTPPAPSLNILIKLMSVVALVIAPLIV